MPRGVRARPAPNKIHMPERLPLPDISALCSVERLSSDATAFKFHRRGRHAVVSMPRAAVQVHLQHGMPALVRAIDPVGAQSLLTDACDIVAAGSGARTPVCDAVPLTAGSIRASRPSTGDAATEPCKSTSPEASAVYVPPFPPHPFTSASEGQGGEIEAALQPASIAERKRLVGSLYGGSAPNSSRTRNGIEVSEVIPACPGAPMSASSRADSPAPTTLACAQVVRDIDSELHAALAAEAPSSCDGCDGVVPQQAATRRSADAQLTAPVSCSVDTQDRFLQYAATQHSEGAWRARSASDSRRKEHALHELASSSPRREHSVIPSRIYASVSAPGSQEQASVSADPCVVANAGIVPHTAAETNAYDAALASKLDAAAHSATSAETSPRTPPARIRGNAPTPAVHDCLSPRAAQTSTKLSAFHASLRSRGLLLDAESPHEAAHEASVLSTRSQSIHSRERRPRSNSGDLSAQRGASNSRHLTEWHTPHASPVPRDFSSVCASLLSPMPSPVPKLPGGASPAICEIDPWEDDSAPASPCDAMSAESGQGPLGPAGSSAAQSLQWRDNAWTGSSWQGRSHAAAGSADGASGRRPTVLCALPTDTPAGLIFGLLLPLTLGWHVVLQDPGFGGHRGACTSQSGAAGVDIVWHAVREHAPALQGILMCAAHCDALTRGALSQASACGGVLERERLAAMLAGVRACGIFGPCVTPPAVQSFSAALQPLGLRCVGQRHAGLNRFVSIALHSLQIALCSWVLSAQIRYHRFAMLWLECISFGKGAVQRRVEAWPLLKICQRPSGVRLQSPCISSTPRVNSTQQAVQRNVPAAIRARCCAGGPPCQLSVARGTCPSRAHLCWAFTPWTRAFAAPPAPAFPHCPQLSLSTLHCALKLRPAALATCG